MQVHRDGMPDGRTVLVVDDEILVRVVAARLLKPAGYRVWEAATAAAALVLLRSAPKPDLILSDVRMPGMNGVAFAEEVRRSWPELPVVLMSGYAPDLPAGLAVGFLSKPFDGEAVLQVIDFAMKHTPAARRHRLNPPDSALPSSA